MECFNKLVVGKLRHIVWRHMSVHKPNFAKIKRIVTDLEIFVCIICAAQIDGAKISACPEYFGLLFESPAISGIKHIIIRKGNVGREYSFGFDLEIQQYRHAWVDSLIEEFSK